MRAPAGGPAGREEGHIRISSRPQLEARTAGRAPVVECAGRNVEEAVGRRATRGIAMGVAALALVAASCGGGGDDKSDTGGTGGAGGGQAVSHGQMCEAAWEDGGRDQARASGQSKHDYMAACVRVMGGGATTTAAP